MIPLYNSSNQIFPDRFDLSFNAGLWYDKFCNTWRVEGGDWTLKTRGTTSPKAQWLQTVAGKKTGGIADIKETLSRRVKMACTLGGKFRVFATQWRFVTGLGREHPVENGFAWHHTLGTAYLPGSSVKGLVRAWARDWDHASTQDINRIFGPDSGEKCVGSIIFFDALPCTPVQLEMDVMTPHYSQYYRGDGPPGDWSSPEPIQFLTVTKGQEFVFTLAPRYLEDDNSAADIELALGWLENALTWAGAGAKTTAGYGRFVRREKEEARLLKKYQEEKVRLEKENHLKEMSPLRLEMEQDGFSSSGFMEVLTQKWLKRMKESQSDEQTEIARLLMNWYKEYVPEQWSKPNKKNKIKIQSIKQFSGE